MLALAPIHGGDASTVTLRRTDATTAGQLLVLLEDLQDPRVG
jgi:hypothetical protein